MRYICAIACVMLIVFLSGCGLPARPAAEYTSLQDAQGRPALGYLQHRQKRYAIQDLMDAEYRQTSGDPFVLRFNPDTTYADNWPSENPSPTFPDTRRIRE